MVLLAGHRIQMRGDRLRTFCHVRQIAMSLCHVALQIPLDEIGKAFGLDRTTVGHACHMMEYRRANPDLDEFVAAVERTVNAVFRSNGVPSHDNAGHGNKVQGKAMVRLVTFLMRGRGGDTARARQQAGIAADRAFAPEGQEPQSVPAGDRRRSRREASCGFYPRPASGPRYRLMGTSLFG
jgi:hypothetical protein